MASESGTGSDETSREVDELRRRNAELEAQVDAPRHRVRRVVGVIIIVIATILTPISTLGFWLKNTITDTDQYVDTIEPLVSDPAIQSFVADRVTERLFTEVDVQSAVQEALPENAAFLSSAITTGVQTVVSEAALRVVESDQFATLWADANRVAQEQLVGALTGDSSTIVTSDDGTVSLDLSGVANEVAQRLSDRGVSLFDSVSLEPGRFTVEIFQSSEITSAQSAFDLFEKVATVLPWLTIALFAIGILVFPNRRRGALWAAGGLCIGTAVLLLGVAVGRSFYLGAIPADTIPSDAAAAFFDTLVRFLRQSGRALLAFGLVALLALVAFGPGRGAQRFRAWVARLLGRVGDQADERGVDFGPVGRWVGRNTMPLRVAVGVLAAVLVVAWERPTAKVVLLVALVALLVLAVIEVVGRSGRMEVAGGGGQAEP